MVSREAEKTRGVQKQQYDKKIRGSVLYPGDRVLVKKTAFKGKRKLAFKWNEAVYIVKCQPNKEIPVYILVKKDRTEEKCLHRNLLLPIAALPGKDVVDLSELSVDKRELLNAVLDIQAGQRNIQDLIVNLLSED